MGFNSNSFSFLLSELMQKEGSTDEAVAGKALEAIRDSTQRTYKQSSAAAGDKTKLASRAGSSVPKASVTAATAEATKRTISGL